MRLGLDFGTTNSAIALYDGQAYHPLISDPLNDNIYITPSLLYIDREGQVTIGAAAANAYLEGETGRPVRWRQREAGEFGVTVASFEGDPIDFLQTVNVLVDEAANGRLLQSIKAALFNGRYEGTQIFGKFYRIDNLIAMILRFLKDAAERQLNEPCDAIVMGRPVRFSDNPLADSRAESILLKAAYLAGFKEVTLELEPNGIAYLQHRASTTRQTVLIFDFGGGTLDLTIAEIGGDTPPRILATEGVLVGGDDLDRRIMESLLPYFGGGDDGRLSPEMSDKLLAWQTMPVLSQPHHMERILYFKRHSSDPAPFNALETLVTRNLGFKLFKEIERVKRELSTHRSVTLHFQHEDVIDIRHTITRRRFERMIDAEIQMVERGIQRVLAKAGTAPGTIDAVLRTGGSSLVPAFYDLLTQIFGSEKQQEIDPLVSVVGGFAVAAHDYVPPTIIPLSQIAEHITLGSGRPFKVSRTGINTLCFADRDYMINRIPGALIGLPLLRLPNLDLESEGDAAVQFDLKMPARVLVAYDSAATQLPFWLREFEFENMQIEIVDEYAMITRIMRVYSRVFPAGQVMLGGNRAAGVEGGVVVNYMCMIQPVNAGNAG
ncbi:MAG: hypothetical protein OHK0046_32270 [Anaerolineae bacterium]